MPDLTPSSALIFIGLLLAVASLCTPRVPLALAVIFIAIGLLFG